METKTEHPEIAEAGRRYLEQYGDPLVTNTYLKIAVLVMALVVAVMAGAMLKEFKQLANSRAARPRRSTGPSGIYRRVTLYP